MALPNTFASVTTINTIMLDQNFDALGALVPIPCNVSGTNSLTLSPRNNTPTVGGYKNYQQFVGIANNTTTNPITAQIGALPVLKVFVDSSAGVAQAGTGQIVADTAFILMYDNTLDSGAGGFHLISTVVAGAFLPLAGGTVTGAIVGTTISLSGPLFANRATVTGAIVGNAVNATVSMAAPLMNASLFSGVSLQVSGAASVGGNLSAGGLKIGTGPASTRQLWASATLAFGAILPQTGSDQTIALAGVKIGDTLMAGIPAPPSLGLAFFPYVSANDTVVMRACNFTTLTLTPPSGVYEVTALGFT